MAATLEVEPVVIRLAWNAELDAIVTRLAAKAGKPKEEWLRRLLLDAIEDAEDYQIAEEAMEEFRASGETSIPADQLRRQLGVAD